LETRLTYGSAAALLRVTTLIVGIILFLAPQSLVLAQGVQPTPEKVVESSSQKTPQPTPQSIDHQALMNNIGTLMDDKLAPLIRMQGNLEKLILEDKFSGPKMTDVIGGIGWILGLGGIAAFFWSFKRTQKK